MTPRTRFLSEALRCYEAGDSLALLNLANDFLIDTTEEEVGSLSADDNQILREMGATLRQAHGEILRNQRLSLAVRVNPDMTKIMVEHLKRLSPDGRDVMLQAYQKALSDRPEQNDQATSESAAMEALDARYARELVDLIPKVVARASSLQELEIVRIPKPSVQRYFDESHRAYFFGLNKACVALCRAILETALKERLGSNNTPHELLELARDRHVLDDERLDSADQIFSAGNSAVHHEHLFDRNYSDSDVERMLLDMRKILEDLCSQA